MTYRLQIEQPTPESHQILCKGGRTGKMVHTALQGSSQTQCGKWLKYQVENFKVSPAFANKMERCGSCFPGAWQETV